MYKLDYPTAWIVVDDCIDFAEYLTTNNKSSIFEDPRIAFYKHLYDAYGAVTLMSCFYCKNYDIKSQSHTGFDLTKMPDKFKQEFIDNSAWLKLSFHSHAANVRYRNGYEGKKDNDFDYSRNAYSDYLAAKAEIIRFAGEQSFFKGGVLHYYDMRKSEAMNLKADGWLIHSGYTVQSWGRGECAYLTLSQQSEMNNNGMVNTDGIVFVLRNFAFERINGSLKVQGTPKRVSQYLERFYHPMNNLHMNPETHEVQITQPHIQQDMNDYCAYCNKHNFLFSFQRSYFFI